MRSSVLLSLVAALPAAYGVAFGGPEPTAIGPDRALDGMSPKPTKGPSQNELRKRQTGSWATCGWLDGDVCMLLYPKEAFHKVNMYSERIDLQLWPNLYAIQERRFQHGRML
jgi:hypothetical protein